MGRASAELWSQEEAYLSHALNLRKHAPGRFLYCTNHVRTTIDGNKLKQQLQQQFIEIFPFCDASNSNQQVSTTAKAAAKTAAASAAAAATAATAALAIAKHVLAACCRSCHSGGGGPRGSICTPTFLSQEKADGSRRSSARRWRLPWKNVVLCFDDDALL